MRTLLHLALAILPLTAFADKVTFAKDRFSVDIPKDWKKAKGPEDGNILYREAPANQGSFSVYKLPVAKNHKADLKPTLETRVKAIKKAGLKVSGELKVIEQDNFDGKAAVFGVVPLDAEHKGQTIKFTYYLVLIDAKDSVIILQAALPRPLSKELQEGALGIIQSFREKE